MSHLSPAQRTRAVIEYDRAKQAEQQLKDELRREEWPLLAPLMAHTTRILDRVAAARTAMWRGV